jgi:predicted  nucleic acid-binding Zn-ribbon protein
LKDTQPSECGSLRGQIDRTNDRIRLLNDAKNDLDPKDSQDKELIEEYNARIGQLRREVWEMRQRMTAIGCWTT